MVAATLIVAIVGLLKISLPESYSFAANTPGSKMISNTIALPTFINIPSLNIGLPIFQSEANMAKISSAQSVLHPSSSAYPGQPGNIVLLGNNRDETFGGILELTKGSEIVVVTKDGMGHEYIVDDVFLTSSSDSKIFDHTPLETLTLVTQAGFLNSKRFVIKAVPLSL
jgi:sortase (surface protein transpeptidase)